MCLVSSIYARVGFACGGERRSDDEQKNELILSLSSGIFPAPTTSLTLVPSTRMDRGLADLLLKLASFLPFLTFVSSFASQRDLPSIPLSVPFPFSSQMSSRLKRTTRYCLVRYLKVASGLPSIPMLVHPFFPSSEIPAFFRSFSDGSSLAKHRLVSFPVCLEQRDLHAHRERLCFVAQHVPRRSLPAEFVGRLDDESTVLRAHHRRLGTLLRRLRLRVQDWNGRLHHLVSILSSLTSSKIEEVDR